jgi:DNA-directed RNA polymerase subunit alpha
MNTHILVPSKPKVILEEGNKAVYEIDNLYPGYGQTLGNSLRRIMHSSVPGVAMTSIKIDGVDHEFSTIEGVVEDVMQIVLHLKRVNFSMIGDGPEKVTIDVKGEKTITAKDIQTVGGVEVINKDQYIAEISKKGVSFKAEITLEKGIGYMAKDKRVSKEKAPVGTIALDADFTPIRVVKYIVEDMRVGDRTDYNKLIMTVETDGTVTPKEAFGKSVTIMIEQLSVLANFAGVEVVKHSAVADVVEESSEAEKEDENTKIKVENLPLSMRTMNALMMAGIKSVAGLVRKSETDMGDIDGLGAKGVEEIKEALNKLGLDFKSEK